MGGFVAVLQHASEETTSSLLPELPGSRGPRRRLEGPSFTADVYRRGIESSWALAGGRIVGLYGYLGEWAHPGRLWPRDFVEASSDAERFAAAYRFLGERAFALARGQWAAFIFDTDSRTLTLARDVPGSRPLFLRHTPRALWIATEARSLWGVDRCGVSPDTEALRGYIDSSTPPGRTAVREVGRVVPGTWTRAAWQGDELLTESGPYWEAPSADLALGNWCEAARELQQVLRRCVARSVPPKGRVGVALSGGLDSSALALTAADLLSVDAPRRLVSVSLRFPGFAGCDEGRFIRALQNQLRWHEEEILVDAPLSLAQIRQVCELVDVPLLINAWLLLALGQRSKASGLHCLLTGHGGDHFLDGDPGALCDLVEGGSWRQALSLGERTWEEASVRSWSLLKHGAARPLSRALKRKWRSWNMTASGKSPLQQEAMGVEQQVILGHLRLEQMSPYFDGRAQLSEAEGMEFRDPFFDLELIDFALRLPPGALMAGGLFKGLLRRAMRGSFPALIADRRDKAEFTAHATPGIEEWFRTAAGELGHLVRLGVLTQKEAAATAVVGDVGSRQPRRETAALGAFCAARFEGLC